MRESIGGGWLMTIVVLFIVLFSSYLAISINYSKAFKVKNFILSVIERREGYTKSATDSQLELIGQPGSDINENDSAQTEIYSYLKEFGYYTDVIGSNTCEDRDLGKTMAGGYCVKHVCTGIGAGSGNYYKVTTFLKIEFPMVKFVLKVPISGETKLIYYDTYDETFECDVQQ